LQGKINDSKRLGNSIIFDTVPGYGLTAEERKTVEGSDKL
jgi:hypothetical protein